MKTIRIGNDINVTWSVLSRNGMPYSLEDKDIELWLTSGPFRMRITAYSIESVNKVSFSIDSPDLKRYGVYKLTLRIFDNAATTQDSTIDLTELFQIVSKSCMDSGILDGAVELEFKSVLNNVFVSTLRGESAYEVAVRHGYQGTEEEWVREIIDTALAGRVAELETAASSIPDLLQRIAELEDTDFDDEPTSDDTDYPDINL